MRNEESKNGLEKEGTFKTVGTALRICAGCAYVVYFESIYGQDS